MHAKSPPRDPEPVKTMQRLRIRLAEANDREKFLEFRRVALETEPEIWLPDELDLNEIRRNVYGWNSSEYQNDYIVVAELDERIIGYLHLSVIDHLMEVLLHGLRMFLYSRSIGAIELGQD